MIINTKEVKTVLTKSNLPVSDYSVKPFESFAMLEGLWFMQASFPRTIDNQLNISVQ